MYLTACLHYKPRDKDGKDEVDWNKTREHLTRYYQSKNHPHVDQQVEVSLSALKIAIEFTS